MLLAGTMLLGCNPKEVLEPGLDYPAFVVIDGDTVKTRDDKSKVKLKYSNFESAPLYYIVGDTLLGFKDIKHTLPAKKVNVAKLKNDSDIDLKGKPLRMVALGQGILTGYRDGGLFNEGMETSLPNLLAQQMGIEFNQPLFDKSNYNGYNKRVKTSQNYTGGPIPKYKYIRNNTGIETVSKDAKVTLAKANLKRVDNFAISGDISTNDNPFSKRFSDSYPGEINFLNILKSNKADFIILAEAYECNLGKKLNVIEDIGINIDGPGGLPRPNGTEGYSFKYNPWYAPEWSPRIEFYIKAREAGLFNKGVLINAPDIIDLPYLNWVKVSDVKNELDKYNPNNYFFLMDKNHRTIDLYKAKYVVPSSEIDSLLGKNVNISLKKGIDRKRPLSSRNFLTEMDINSNGIIARNQETQALAKELNFALVDLFTIYKKIHAGTYVSVDGIKVLEKDFFSSDGVFPSAYGQAVIANETIKAINSQYGLNIELINTRQFLNP